MTEIYLVRHGQASFGQDNYDVLSELGKLQARWLGQWFNEQELHFDGLYSGQLQRQIHTLNALSQAQGQPVTAHMSEFDEFDFMQVVGAFLKQYPGQDQQEQTPRFWFKTLGKSMQAWSTGELQVPDTAESWHTFVQRVKEGLNQLLSQGHKRVVVATSGGVIACATGLTLGLGADNIIKLNLQIQNTSVTRLIVNPHSWSLHSFNSVPHLSSRERAPHITYA